MAVETSDKPKLPHDYDDDDDAPIIYKRFSSKKNQSLSEARKSSSQIHEGQSYRQIPNNAPSSNGQTSTMQKGNNAPSLKPSAMKPSVGISRAPNSVGNTSSVKLPVANSKSPSLADRQQKMSIDVKVEPKSTERSGKDFYEDSEDDEDNKPLSFRLKNSNHDNKVTSVVKKSPEDSDDDDDVPLAKKLSRNFNLGTTSSNHDDSDKKPISKIQKERQNGSGMGNKQDRPSPLPAKRPLDNSNSLQPSVKKPKVAVSDASIKTKPVFEKRELKVEDDDDDDLPISQRIKKQAMSGEKSSSIKKVVTKVTKVNKSSSKPFKKQAKKIVKKSGSGSEYSKSSKLLPSSGDGQKKWTTLVHNGVIFPPPYQRHGVKMLYKGRPVDLTPEQEEVGFSL